MATRSITSVFGNAITEAFAPRQRRAMSPEELRSRLDGIRSRSLQRRNQADERYNAVAYGQLSEEDIVDLAIVRVKRREANKHAPKRGQ